MSWATRRRMIVVLILFLLVLVLIGIVVFWTTGSGVIKTVAVVQGGVTLVVIAIGGAFALYKLEAFREFRPHLTVSQIVSHRKVGYTYVHISVHVSLVNTSKVKIEIRNASFWMQQIAPFADQEVEQFYSDFRSKPDNDKYIPFPTLEVFNREWDDDELVIEPGESGSQSYEFIVKDHFDAVSVTAFFNDQTTGEDAAKQTGWAAVSVYNIK